MDGYTYGWIDTQMDGTMDGQKDGWMNRWIDGWIDGQNDGLMDRWIYGYTQTNTFTFIWYNDTHRHTYSHTLPHGVVGRGHTTRLKQLVASSISTTAIYNNMLRVN